MPTKPTSFIENSEQAIQNSSFDKDFGVSVSEILGYDPDAGTLNRIKVNSDGELIANLETADIEIGAVEIKDATTDTRAVVGANGLEVLPNEVPPTDASKNNPSTALSYDGSGNLQYIDETIAGTTYRTTLTYDGSNVLQSVSAAVEL